MPRTAPKPSNCVCSYQVVVEGNIASGKSTLLKKLSQIKDVEVDDFVLSVICSTIFTS